MGLLSIFKRDGDTPRATPTSESGDEVQRARTRARRRLIGAAVLLGIGIVGFPLVFETQPRPIPVNIPIETPAKEGAAPLAMPPARPAATPAPVAAATPAPAPPKPAAASTPVITESRDDAGREVASAAPVASAPAPARAASKPAVVAPKPVAEAKPPEAKPPVEAKPAERKPAEAKPAVADAKPAQTDAARARALLEGKPDAAASDAGRFVVQVGAFSDVAAAHETRAKVEKLGLKTYTQVATTAGGKRIRVRAGPYNSRAEADKALAKARAAGLTAVVLTL